ncbi:hypothetical protein [Chromobacterium subtsugae]|uniref:hypothetical protein n=1 Tax=Chromobacterium subtsugae TaxID=251747 RepID=UPI000B27C298|nr:hypothetical protein [Chromobacterium subtsugae]
MALNDFKRGFLNKNLISILSECFKGAGNIDIGKVKSLGWGGYALDDINIFDEDAVFLSMAMKSVDVSSVFLVRDIDIGIENHKVECLVFDPEKKRLEEFQKFDFHLELPLLDCVLFDEKFQFLIHRPANFDKDMMYFGPQAFLDVAVVGNGWRKIF